jgi:hypothetical protein
MLRQPSPKMKGTVEPDQRPRKKSPENCLPD